MNWVKKLFPKSIKKLNNQFKTKSFIPHQRGYQAEQLACNFLVKRGFNLIQQNYHWRFGEIDLIFEHKDTIVFVEVRLKTQKNYVSALDSIGASKQRKIVMTAQYFLQQFPEYRNRSCQFDVITFTEDSRNYPSYSYLIKKKYYRLEWLRNAFEGF